MSADLVDLVEYLLRVFRVVVHAAALVYFSGSTWFCICIAILMGLCNNATFD